jgi:ABC-type branched-chain amino acid transport system, permease component
VDYFVGLVILASIYTIGALSLNILQGHGGVFSVATAAFMGIGAYATGAVTVEYPALFLPAMAIGAVLSALLGYGFAQLTLRVNGDYMVVASFALVVIVGQTILNLPAITGGGMGIPGIPRPGTDDVQLNDNLPFAIFCVAITALVYLACHFILKSPFGDALRTLREDPIAASALGRYPRRFRAAVFAGSSAIAAISGSVYAHYISYISPADFTVKLTITILTVVVVAGTNRLWAIPLGAAVVIGLTEGARYLPLPDQIAAGADQILFGALLVAFALLRPQGLIGPKKDTRSAK